MHGCIFYALISNTVRNEVDFRNDMYQSTNFSYLSFSKTWRQFVFRVHVSKERCSQELRQVEYTSWNVGEIRGTIKNNVSRPVHFDE